MKNPFAKKEDAKLVPADAYLGDGVYISFDGYQWWLARNDHRNKVIALEPAVVDALIAYVERTKDFYKVYAKVSDDESKT